MQTLENKKSLDDVIQSGDSALVLFFWDTCNKCHFREQELEKLDIVKVFKFNATENLDVCNYMNIISVPVLVYFSNWKEVWRLEEIQPNDVVINKITEAQK